MNNPTGNKAQEYSLLVPFTDDSPSYTEGFEAGMVWAWMEEGKLEIESRPYHVENLTVLKHMAARMGYAMEVSPEREVDGWVEITFTKNMGGLRLVTDNRG